MPDKTAGLEALTDRLAKASEAELARYSEDQLDAIADFLARMTEVTRTESTALRDSPEAPLDTGPAEHTAPLGGVTSAASSSAPAPTRSRSAAGPARPISIGRGSRGPSPRSGSRDGIVSIQYRSGRAWDWRQARTADLAFELHDPVDGRDHRRRVQGDRRREPARPAPVRDQPAEPIGCG